jgi:hypothetical protein
MTFEPGIAAGADADPIDSRLAATQGRPEPDVGSGRVGRRPTFPLPAIFRRALVLLPLGMSLGPHGLNLLSQTALSYLDPLVSVTLAMLGVCLGVRIDLRNPRDTPLLAAASLEAVLTIIAVAGGIAAVHLVWIGGQAVAWLPLMLGICAAASVSGATDGVDHGTGPGRIGDLDNILAITFGSVALALMGQGSPLQAALLVLGLCTTSAMIALAGWLLVAQTPADSEQHAFLAGTLLLLGGAAAYLSESPLFAGLVAGLVWTLVGGVARDRILRDIRYLQHPLVVLLFLVAGAHLELWVDALVLAFVYLLCRTAGKLAGSWWVLRSIPRAGSPHLGLTLVSPGVIGVALALNALQVSGEPWRPGTLLAVVVIGSLSSELLSIVVRAPEEAS